MLHFKILCGILFIHFSTSLLINDRPKNLPFPEYHVTSTNLLNFENASEIRERIASGIFTFKIDVITGTIYEISIHLKPIEVMNWKTNFQIYGENLEELVNIKNAQFEMVEGVVVSEQNASYVVGYIQDVSFYGTITFENTIYYVDKLKNYPEIFNKYNGSNYNAVVYKEDFLNFSLNTRETLMYYNNRGINFINADIERDIFKAIIGNGKVCTLFVLIDTSFLRRVHNNNIRSATLHVLNSVERANSLFRSTDFDEDGFPDNLGLIIKNLIVLQSEKSPMNLLPRYTGYPIDGALYINMFSQYKLLNDVCLGVAFTGQTFKNNVLGISYTAEPTDKTYFKYSIGGICDRPFKHQKGMNLNTLAIAPVLENGNIVPQHIFDLSLAHELGHSFGSDHDVTEPCIGYLMSSHTPSDSQRKRFIFSSCSKRSIMKTIISKGHCFQKYMDPFCGNGIVEAGEECDCGTARDCQYFDVCCTPQGQKNACKVNKQLGYDCHPSQGICCTSICTYKDLSNFNLDCKSLAGSCPCQGNSDTCLCEINGKCTADTCSSQECTRISLKECECPFTNNKCRTCCSYDGYCLPSIDLTEKMIEKEKGLITKLKQIEIKKEQSNTKIGVIKDFYFNNTTVKLYFREVEESEYCLLYGQVGICTKNGKCATPTVRQIYPSLQTSDSSRNEIYKLSLVLNIFCIFACSYYIVKPS